MEVILGKIYSYEEIAQMIVKRAEENAFKVIGITGTSSVGKSTFANMIKRQLEEGGGTVQVLRTDDYLKERYRAANRFWNRLDSTYLKPEFFDWQRLMREIEQLNEGQHFERECYIRGIGWSERESFVPADFYLIEGLFMDSVEAAKFMHYDFLISLVADDQLITKLRIERDAYYRANFKDFQRTESETLKEIENTLMAGKAYRRYDGWKKSLKMVALGDYNARIEMLEKDGQ